MQSKFDLFKQGFATRLGFLTKEERKEIEDIKRGRGESDWGAFKRGFREYIFGDIRDDMPGGKSGYDLSGVDGMPDMGTMDLSPIEEAVNSINKTTKQLYTTAQAGLAVKTGQADRAQFEQAKEEVQQIYRPKVTKREPFEPAKIVDGEEIPDRPPTLRPVRKPGLSMGAKITAGIAAIGAGTVGLSMLGKKTRETSRVATPMDSIPLQSSPSIVKDIPPEGRALLDAISVPESGGRYDILVGAGKGGYSLNEKDKAHNKAMGVKGDPPESFSDYSKHPNIRGFRSSHGYSTAAGRYQITKSTWDDLRKRYSLPDFSPDNQDRAAWYLAQERYTKYTKGRNLATDLANGTVPISDIAKTLSPTWASLAGGVQEQSKAGVQDFSGNYYSALEKRSAEYDIVTAQEHQAGSVVIIDNTTTVNKQGQSQKEELDSSPNPSKSFFDYFR